MAGVAAAAGTTIGIVESENEKLEIRAFELEKNV